MKKKCIVVTDVVMTLLVPAECVMYIYRVVITLFITQVLAFSLRMSHKSRCGVPNSTVKVINFLKELNKVTLFVTYFYIRTKLAIVVVVVS